MKEVALYSIGSPPAFTRTTADANYWQERWAYELSYNLYLRSQQDFSATQEEESDRDSVETDLDNWLVSYDTWAENAIEKRRDNLPVPAPPAFPDLSNATAQVGLANFLAKLQFRANLTLFRFGGSGEIDSEDLRDVLEEIRDAIKAALLYDTNKSILYKAYLDDSTGSVVSLLHLFGTQPVEIWVGSNGGIENIGFVCSSD